MTGVSSALLLSVRDDIVSLAQQAGGMIQQRVGNHGEVEAKDAGSTLSSQVVTAVDREVQDFICQGLLACQRDHAWGLLAEESEDDSSRLEKDYFWCIDPIDGTLPFIEGVPGYSVSIALVSRDGQSVLGVVYDPVADKTYAASRDAGAQVNAQSLLHPRTPSDVSSGAILYLYVDRSFPKDARFQEFSAGVMTGARELGYADVRLRTDGASVLNACWCLEAEHGLYCKFPKPEQGGGSFWDFAASSCIARESGAVVTDIHGAALHLNRPGSTFMNAYGIVYATTPALAALAYRLFRQS